jgi:hypothetical protein
MMTDDPVVFVVVRKYGYAGDVSLVAYLQRQPAEAYRDHLNGAPYDPDEPDGDYAVREIPLWEV